MPGLKGIENIKKSMGQRVEEREVRDTQNPAAAGSPAERFVAPVSSKPGRYSKYSTIRKSYEEKGVPPRRHLELYKAIKTALDGKWEGELDFGVVLETIQMNRASANLILGHLEHFGYIQYEGRFRRTWFKILK